MPPDPLNQCSWFPCHVGEHPCPCSTSPTTLPWEACDSGTSYQDIAGPALDTGTWPRGTGFSAPWFWVYKKQGRGCRADPGDVRGCRVGRDLSPVPASIPCMCVYMHILADTFTYGGYQALSKAPFVVTQDPSLTKNS